MTELGEYLKKWSEKLSIPEEDIKKEYDSLLDEEKAIHIDLNDEDHKTRALQRLAMSYKKQLRSPAVGFEGMIIGVGDAIDTVARIRAEAIKMFKENPQQAISSGITNEEGEPLDTREKWASGQPNRRFGKPLPEHNFLKTVFGVALKKNVENSVKFFILNLTGEMAKDDNIPIFKPVSFRAIDRTPQELDEKEYRLNFSVFTKFTVDESITVPPVNDLINNYCNHLKVNLSDLDKYHDANEDDFNRLVIVEGDVSTLILDPTIVGSRRLILDQDQEDIDLESEGTTCWVPLRTDIDFAEQSKVIVIGRTARGKKRDDQGNFTDEPGDVMINVFGLYCLPEYKIQPNIIGLTEEVVETEDESDGGEIKEKVTEKETVEEDKSSSPEGGW